MLEIGVLDTKNVSTKVHIAKVRFSYFDMLDTFSFGVSSNLSQQKSPTAEITVGEKRIQQNAIYGAKLP